jgi:hypothetical protein
MPSNIELTSVPDLPPLLRPEHLLRVLQEGVKAGQDLVVARDFPGEEDKIPQGEPIDPQSFKAMLTDMPSHLGVLASMALGVTARFTRLTNKWPDDHAITAFHNAAAHNESPRWHEFNGLLGPHPRRAIGKIIKVELLRGVVWTQPRPGSLFARHDTVLGTRVIHSQGEAQGNSMVDVVFQE